MVAMPQEKPRLWFGKKEGGLGFGPITRQGRTATALYVFLVVVAIFTYSQLALTGFVVVFYTFTFGFLVVAKSDLIKDHQGSLEGDVATSPLDSEKDRGDRRSPSG
jgi:hypothetical protein